MSLESPANENTTSSTKSRSFSSWVLLYLKGMAMGAADIVPGVSGGTVAFITGIYEELILTLKAYNFRALKILWQHGFKQFWLHVNGPFLIVLLAGIVTSLISLVQVITWAMDSYPQLLWSFFFGLILASAWILSRSLTHSMLKNAVAIMAGFACAWWISGLVPNIHEPSLLYVFVAGSIAICAMVLPGISGSFLLLLMGVYFPVLSAIEQRDIALLGCFAAGAILGLLSFVHFLGWLLERYKEPTFAVLVGFLLGSLKMLWPWKHYQQLTGLGHEKSYAVNVSPEVYQQLGPHLALEIYCLVAAIVGVIIVLSVYFTSAKSA